jgi:tetratricopeptide (TPR) repeat protein
VEADLEGAAEALRGAIRARAEPWTRTARLTLGQLLLRLGRPQQAMFELRKVAAAEPLDLEGVQALAFLSEALRAQGKGREAEALADRRRRALARRASEGGPTGAIARAWLGFELKHAGERRPARAALEAALADPELPDAERAAVAQALDAL